MKSRLERLCQADRLRLGRHGEAHREYMMKTWRAASVFRIKIEDLLATEVAAKDKVELLYGKERDWVFEPTKSEGSDAYDGYQFVLRSNELGQKPRFGDEGFGHQGMVYTFTFVEHDGKLFLGLLELDGGPVRHV